MLCYVYYLVALRMGALYSAYEGTLDAAVFGSILWLVLLSGTWQALYFVCYFDGILIDYCCI